MKTTNNLISFYKIIEEIGRGNKGIVYKAIDLFSDEVFAIKVLYKNIVNVFRKNEIKERLIKLSNLNHPNLVKIYDIGINEEEEYYIVMEYVEGYTLNNLKDSNIEDIYIIINQLCQALNYLHFNELVHFSLRPSNVMIVEKGTKKELKLTDFGLYHHNIQNEKDIIKSLNYMAPEIVKGKDVDTRSDLYSLGAILYELLTEQLPFPEENEQVLIKKYLDKEPISPIEINENIKTEIGIIVMKLLSKEPKNRYDNALDVIREINIAIGKEVNHKKDIISNIFIGREKEQTVLNNLLDENINGKGKLILIKGESGIGKSFLMNRFKLSCHLRNSILIIGQCYGLENISYKPIIEILLQLIAILENKHKQNLIRKFKQSLIRLIPELRNKEYCMDLVKEKLPEMEFSQEKDKTRLIDEISNFFIETRKIFPYVIFIDDFHLTDKETLNMIRYFSVDSSLLIIVTCRTEEIGNNKILEKMILNFQEESYYEELTLNRFNFNKTKLMINHILNSYTISERLLKTVYNNTLGNSLFIREELISLIEEGILYRDYGRWFFKEENYKNIKISSNVKELISNRIKNLSEINLEVLRILSISITGVRKHIIELISKILDLRWENTKEILDELISESILVEQENSYNFYHPKIKEVAELTIDLDKQKILHQKVGEILEEIYKDDGIIESKVEELAYHFVSGIDKEKALKYSLKASEITERSYVYHKTIEHYENILSISDMKEIKGEIALVYEFVGNYDKSIYSWKELLKDSKDKVERGNIYRYIGGLYRRKGNYQEAMTYYRLAEKELSLSENPLDLELSKLYVEIGNYYYIKENYNKSISMCEKCLETLKEKDSKISSATYTLLGSISFRKCKYKEAIEYFKKSLKLNQEINDKRGVVFCYHNIALVLRNVGKINEAINYFNKCLENKISIDIYLLKSIHSNLGGAYILKHDYELANIHLFESMRMAKKIGDYRKIVINYINLGIMHLEKGMFRIALDYSDKAYVECCNIGVSFLLLNIYSIKSRAYLSLDEIDESLKYCKKALEIINKNDNPYGEEGNIYRILGLIYQKKNNYQKAEEYFKKSEEILIKSENKTELAETYYYKSHFHKKKVEVELEKAVKIYEKTDLLDELEITEKELRWIKKGRTDDLQKYKILYEITQMITSILALNQLLPIIIDKIIEITKANKGFLLLMDDKEEFTLEVAHDSNKMNINKAEKDIEWDIIKKTLKSKKPILVTEYSDISLPVNGENPSIMCAPLIIKNKIIGVIYVCNKSKERIFKKDDLDFFKLFANQVAVSIENAILYKELLKKEREASEFRTISQLRITPFNVKEVPEEINKVISISQKIYEENMTEYGFGEMIGKSPNMEEIYNLISKVAVYDTTVLILGESGTGKELVSEEIHRLSKRKTGKLIKINTANLNKDLLETEIFGHEKGAFTGAHKSKKGKLELAHNGTLFLDEINSLPLNLQSKLLRVLETKSFYKVGGNELINSNFRLICATNADLKDIVSKGKFREDLYYRIYKFVIKMPALRERKEDLYLLFNYFINNNEIAKEKGIKHISEEAWKILENYNYPGNVRELLNMLEGIIIVCEDEQIRLEHLPNYLTEKIKTNIEETYQKIINKKPSSKEEFSYEPKQRINEIYDLLVDIIRQNIDLEEKGCIGKLFEQIKKSLIMYLLKKLNNNIVMVSQMVNISYSALKRKLKKYNDISNPKDEKYEKNPSFINLIKFINEIIDNNIANNEKEVILIFDIEKKIIETILNEMEWKKKDASTLLGIDRKTLNKKLIKYKIAIPK